MEPTLFRKLVRPRTVAVASAGFYRALTIDHTQCGGSDSAGLTVVVSITLNDLKDLANGGYVSNASAYDIIFSTDTAGASLLNWEVKAWKNTSGALVAWVKFPTISHTADTVFYMHYGNTSISTWQGGTAGTAWDSSYVMALHLNETTGPYADSTANGNGSIAGTYPSYGTGKIYQGQTFNGSSNYLDCGNHSTLNLPTQFTCAFWINLLSLPSVIGGIIGKASGGINQYYLYVNPSGVLIFYASPTRTALPVTLSLSTWQHFVVTTDSSHNTKVYLNGSLQGTLTKALYSNNTGHLFIGGQTSSSFFVNAILEEMYLLNTVWTADQVTTVYNNQNNPTSFITVGAAIAA